MLYRTYEKKELFSFKRASRLLFLAKYLVSRKPKFNFEFQQLQLRFLLNLNLYYYCFLTTFRLYVMTKRRRA